MHTHTLKGETYTHTVKGETYTEEGETYIPRLMIVPAKD